MKIRKLAFVLLLSPIIVAMQCDEDDDCGYFFPAPYIVDVGNDQSAYSVNDTIWLSAEMTSKFLNSCEPENDSIIVSDPEPFREGLFLLKLISPQDGKNAANAATELEVVYDIAVPEQGISCAGAFQFFPVLTDDQQKYKYRVGVVPHALGTFAVVFSSASTFSTATELHVDLSTPFALPEGTVRFEGCGDIFTRDPAYRQAYFFQVQ
jgi:hypothetical protein